MPDNQKKSHQNRRKLSAQALVELALILPILLVLIISAMEFGRLFYTKIVITNAAREGAYYLSTHESDYDHITGLALNTVIAAKEEAKNSGISTIAVGVTPLNCCEIGTYSIKVTVQTNVHDLFILSFLGNFLSLTSTTYDEFPLSSSVEMMVQ